MIKLAVNLLNLNLELANHAFNFGVSMTQEGPFEGTAYQDMYRQRVSEVFNFVTLVFIGVPEMKKEVSVVLIKNSR